MWNSHLLLIFAKKWAIKGQLIIILSLSREKKESNKYELRIILQSRKEIEANNFEAIQKAKKRTAIVILASVNINKAISTIELVENNDL